MKISTPRAAMGALAAAFLASCTGATPQTPSLASAASNARAPHADALAGANHLSLAAAPFVEGPPDRRPSWIAPDAPKAFPLLFVADSGIGDVVAYTMPGLKLTERITGFKDPQGVCADAQGNIWVAATNAQQIYQYSRTGKLLQTINDNLGYPAGCAINLKTGDLAVTNIDGVGGGRTPGNLLIYQHASGNPKRYTGANLLQYLFVGYDATGNLYVDGCATTTCFDGGGFVLAQLPKGGTQLGAISISGGTIYYPAMVEWYSNGNKLLVGDQKCGGGGYSACVYQVQIAGTSGTITASTTLHNVTGGTACDVPDAALTKSETSFAGGDIEFSSSQCPSFTVTATYKWAFPTGGNPTQRNPAALDEPIGAAISY